MRVRKVFTAVAASTLAVGLVGAGIDTGAAIYAEYQLSRHVRSAAGLPFDPWVAILGFPFIPQALRHRYDELEIKANGVEHPVVGNVTLESTMHDIGLSQATWLMRPDADLPVGMLESRIIIDSRHLGTFIGIKDLAVEAPLADTNDPTGGTTESGISGSTGFGLHRHTDQGRLRQAGQRDRRSLHHRAGPDHPGLHPDRRGHRPQHRR